jgi:hypothetical protein
VAAAISWTAVCTSVAIDLRLGYNAAFICTLGEWVMSLETLILSDPSIGWEHFIKSSELLGSPIYPFARLNTISLTPLLYACVMFLFCYQPIFLYKQSESSDESKNVNLVARISTFFGCAYFLMLFCFSLTFHLDKPLLWTSHCAIWLLVGVFGVSWSLRSLRS